ncbi:MAG: GTPase [Nanoarchaeota archaeon]
MGFWPVVENVIKNSDIVLFIIDARMPELSRNIEIERKVKRMNKNVVYVFNKIDLLSGDSLNELKRNYKEGFFVSGTKNLGIGEIRKHLHILSKKMKIKYPRIGVVGYPNIGKSAIINALARRARTVVSAMPGTTKGVQWVNAGSLRILDSPGVIPYEDKASKLALFGSKAPDKMSNPDKAAIKILDIFIVKNRKALEEHYGIEVKLDDTYKVFLDIGKKKGLLGKGGVVDEHRTAVFILREWHKGKLKL